MSLENLIADYGASGLFVGSAAEGEAVAMLGGVMAHRGLLAFRDAVLAVAAGSFLVDLACCLIGRAFRQSPRIRRLQGCAAGRRVLARFDRHPNLFVFGFRFLYGMRAASALTIGTTGFPLGRFVLLNASAALVWALIFVSIGFASGQAITAVFGLLSIHRHLALAGGLIIAATLAAAVIVHKARRGRAARA